jgi:hypothetical protein
LATKEDIKKAQQIVGTLLYTARAVDPTLIMTLSSLAARLSTATATTMDAITHLLDYCTTNQESTIRYYASDMQLKIHSDASYLSEPKAKSRIGGYFYLGKSNASTVPDITNGPLYCHSSVLKHVVSSVAEAEFGAIFINAKEGTVTRNILEEMGHPQEATVLTTDNTTASGISNKTVQQKRSKAMDMRFYWIQDRIEQKQFDVRWAAGDTNLADYYTKHHPPAHHKRLRPFYLHSPDQPMVRHDTKLPVLRGCVNLCTTSQREQGPVPLYSQLGRHPSEYTGENRHTPAAYAHTTYSSTAPLSHSSKDESGYRRPTRPGLIQKIPSARPGVTSSTECTKLHTYLFPRRTPTTRNPLT